MKNEFSFSMPSADVTITAELEKGDFSFDEALGTIRGYNGSGGNIVIPSEINGVQVQSIGEDAFKNCKNLAGIIIPQGVVHIEDYAFYGCTSLRKVTLPETLKEIGYGAFVVCESLIEIRIPGKVSKLGNYAFYGCGNLKSVYFAGKIPAMIGEFAFDCTAPDFRTLYSSGYGTGQTVKYHGRESYERKN
ncbi:leucine-rich repeat domain-containing protein [Desulfosporosinus sp. PR]|nr:leucine-rich repeat domain-containing protein [Desulfosporosinus sp. PR]